MRNADRIKRNADRIKWTTVTRPWESEPVHDRTPASARTAMNLSSLCYHDLHCRLVYPPVQAIDEYLFERYMSQDIKQKLTRS
jgi:hypothetical protein